MPSPSPSRSNDPKSSTSIIVIADGDLIANETNKNGNIYPLGYDKFINYTFEGNKKFIINAIQFLTDNNGLINLRSKNIKLRLLNNDLIANYRILIIILNIFLPLILFLILIYSTNKILRVKIN